MRINLATDPRDKWVEFLKGWMVTTRLLREQQLLKEAQRTAEAAIAAGVLVEPEEEK